MPTMQNIHYRIVSFAAIVITFFVVSGPAAHAEPTLDTSSFENFESSITALIESLESNVDLSITERGQVAVLMQSILMQLAMSVAENPDKTPRELRAEALKKFSHLNGLTAKQLLTAPARAPADPEGVKEAREILTRWRQGEETEPGLTNAFTLSYEFGEGEFADRVKVYVNHTESGARLHMMTGILKSDLSGYKYYLGGKHSDRFLAADVAENFKIESLEIITEPINTFKTWVQKILSAPNKPSFMVREIPITSKARIEGSKYQGRRQATQNPPLIWAVWSPEKEGLYVYRARGTANSGGGAGTDTARSIVAENAELLTIAPKNLSQEDLQKLWSLNDRATIAFSDLFNAKITSDLPVVFETALKDAQSQRQQKATADIQRKNRVAANEDALDDILGPATTAKPTQNTSASQPSGMVGRSVTYRSRIGARDLRNSKGVFLPDIPSIQARDILLQDRFNYHQRGIRDPEDTHEGLYEEGKETMRKFFEGKVARLADGGDPMPLLSTEPVIDVTLTESEIVVTPVE